VDVLGRRAEGVLRVPEAVALAPGGSLYVADQRSYVIQRFSRTGRFEGEWGSYGTGPGQFAAVNALEVDAAGNVYAVDSAQNRVQVFDARGRFLRWWGGRGTRLGEFDFGGGGNSDRPPGGGIAVHLGFVYVSDTANDRIVRFRLDGTHPTLVAGRGQGSSQVLRPRGLVVQGSRLYVADNGNHRVDVLSLTGRPLARFGVFGHGTGQFSNPYDVALDAQGNVFVADDNNNRVVELSPRLTWLRAWSTTPDPADPLGYVRALVAEPSGRTYVAVSGKDQVVVFSAAGRRLRAFGRSTRVAGQLISPVGVGVGPTGRVYVAEAFGGRSRVDVFDAALRPLRSWTTGGAILGHDYFSPVAVAGARGGSAWIVDTLNGVVRHVDARGRLLGAVGGAGSAAGQLRRPSGVALGPDGTVYVADTGNDRVQAFSPRGRLRSSFAAHVRLSAPSAVAIGPGGRLFVVDAGHRRVVVLSPDGRLVARWRAAGVDEIAVDGRGRVFLAGTDRDRIEMRTTGGRPLGEFGRTGTGAGELSSPRGVVLDCHGDLLVADWGNNRVQRFVRVAAPGRCG
jgi:sugar lactone lactonase YvrE